MKIAASVFLLSCCIKVSAQDPSPGYKAAVKLYNISTLQVVRHGAYFGTNNTPSYDLEVMHGAPAVQWQGRQRHFHEAELTRLLVNRSYQTYDVSTPGGGWERSGTRNVTHIALRYEYIVTFGKKESRKLVPSLGLGLAPSFFRQSFEPGSVTLFNTSTTHLGLDGQVIPRLNYHLNSRIYLDLNIPVSAIRLGTTTSTNRNPVIPARQQKISNVDLSLAPSHYSVRFGVGFRL